METKGYDLRNNAHYEGFKREPLEIGSIIKGTKASYKLERFIGKGGTSLVYRARTSEGLVVIIKEFYPIFNQSIQRRGKELWVAEELRETYKSFMDHEKKVYELSKDFIAKERSSNDPHSWNYIEAFCENNTYYQVCEDVEGVSLDKILKDKRWKLEDMSDYIQLGLAMIPAIHSVHRMGYVHCDLKPENMYVVASNPPVFRCIDYGSAVSEGSTQIISSSYKYAAPQIPFSNKGELIGTYISGGVQYSFDIYSVLTILYQEITGKSVKECVKENEYFFDREKTDFVDKEKRKLLNISDEALLRLNLIFRRGLERTSSKLQYNTLDEFENDLLEIKSMLENKVYLHSVSTKGVLPRIDPDPETEAIFKNAIEADVTLTYFAVEEGEDYLKTCAQFFSYCAHTNRRAKLVPVMFRNSLKDTLLALPFGTKQKEVQEEDLFAKLARLDDSYYILILGYRYKKNEEDKAHKDDREILKRLSEHKYTKYFFFGEKVQERDVHEKFGKVFWVDSLSSEQKLITNFRGIPLKYFVTVPNYGICKAVLQEFPEIDMNVVEELCREENLYKFGDKYYANPKLLGLSQRKEELNDEVYLESIRIFLSASKKEVYRCMNQYQKFTRNDLDICKELLLKTKCSQESSDTLSEIYSSVDKERWGGALKELYESYFENCQNETRNYLHVLGDNIREFCFLLNKIGDKKSNLKKYNKILFEVTKDPELWIGTYFRKKQFDKVITTTTMLIELYELYGGIFKYSIDEYYEKRAEAYLELGDTTNAEKEYTKLIQRGVKKETVYVGRARVYEKLRKLNCAEEDYTTNINIYPNSWYAWAYRGQFYDSIKGEYQKSESDFYKAIEICNENIDRLKHQKKDVQDILIEWDKNSSILYAKLAGTQIHLKHWKDAEISIAIALKLDSNNGSAWNEKGNLYNEYQDYTNAEISYLIASKKKNDSVILSNLAEAQINLKKWEDAKKNIQKSLELDPSNARAWSCKAALYHEKKDYANAEFYYLGALEKNKYDCVILNDLVNLQIELEHWEDAEKNIQTILTLEPNNARAWNQKGNLRCGQERYAEAEWAYKIALELEKNNEIFKENLCKLYEILERKSVNIYQENKKKLNDAASWYLKGISYKKQKEYQKAEECFRKSVELVPKKIEYLFELANVKKMHHNKKEIDLAVSFFEKIIDIDLTYHQAWNGLGDIYSDQGDLKTALFYYEQALKLDPNNEVYKEDVTITREELGLQ